MALTEGGFHTGLPLRPAPSTSLRLVPLPVPGRNLGLIPISSALWRALSTADVADSRIGSQCPDLVPCPATRTVDAFASTFLPTV